MELICAILSLLISAEVIESYDDPSTEVRSDLRHFVSERGPDRSILTGFYQVEDFAPVWVGSGRPTPQALALIGALDGAADQGLNPADYRVERLRTTGATPSDIAHFDLSLTISALRFAADLRFGRVNPKVFHFKFDRDRGEVDTTGWIRSHLVRASNIGNELSSLDPPFEGFRRSKRMLATYRKLAAEGEGTLLLEMKTPVKAGGPYPGLAGLATRLQRLGDLPGNSVISDAIYSGAVVEAVKHFQARHGLDSDGVLGSATIRTLNVPLSQRVRQIELTLERWRWVPHSFARPPLVVNIPEFELRALDESGRTALQMKVVVGKAYGHKTPVFSAEMKYLIFRPYWDVPESIAHKELLPKAAADPGYLAKNHYETVPTVNGGSRIRQAPGPDNALGGVKFLFPNEFDVYLHGTPAVELFSRSRRDFSHGCIRVEKPEALAAWVLRNGMLRDKPEWTRERIREAMNAKQPLRVNLDAPIPVLIVYGTVVVEENGDVRFFDDIYGYDAALAQTLAGLAGREKQ